MPQPLARMLRRPWLIVLAVALLCTGIGAIGFYLVALPSHLRFAVSSVNTDDQKFVQALTQQFSREHTSTRLRAIVKDGGTREVAAALDAGEADFAIVRRDVAMPQQAQAVAILRRNIAVFVVPARRDGRSDAPAIKKVPDLVGKRIGIVGSTQANIDLFKVVLQQYHIAPEKAVMEPVAAGEARDQIRIVRLAPTGNVSAAIRDSKVDAVLVVAPVSSPLIAEAVAAMTRSKEPPSFLPVGANEAIAERNRVYEATEIKAGAFGGSPPQPPEEVDAVAVNHYILARKTLDEGIVAEFSRVLFANRQALTAESTSGAKIEAPKTDKDAPVPVHPGTSALIDGTVKTFFERYGDWIYLGIMIVSFFGSGLAGVTSYSSSNARNRRMAALERLLELTKAARTAETTRELDGLLAEVDDILGEMVREAKDDVLDEAALMAFSVSLDQARDAIADRRSILSGQPARRRAAVASA